MTYFAEKSLKNPSAKKANFKLGWADSWSSEWSSTDGIYSHNEQYENPNNILFYVLHHGHGWGTHVFWKLRQLCSIGGWDDILILSLWLPFTPYLFIGRLGKVLGNYPVTSCNCPVILKVMSLLCPILGCLRQWYYPKEGYVACGSGYPLPLTFSLGDWAMFGVITR